MTLQKSELENHLQNTTFATMVTRGAEGMAARTMMIGYDANYGVFLLTRNATDKMKHIAQHKEGLVHLGEITEDLTASYDIQLSGTFAIVESGSEHFSRGVDVLAGKNAMIRDLMSSPAQEDYSLLLFTIRSTTGYTYQQAVDGLPKTVLG